MGDVMTAAVIHTCGEPPKVATVPAPTAGRSEAGTMTVVAVTAAPITPLDVLCATGTSYFGRPAVPYVPGVSGVGEALTGALAGRRVWFPTSAGMRPGNGSLAERCVVAEADLVPVPNGVLDAEAAALGPSAVAAWMALTWRAGLKAGERVLVLGAGGAVGQVAVRAARLLGASRVVAACRSDAAREAAQAAGADEVVPLTPGQDADELAKRFSEALDGGADVVIDPLCGVPATAAARVLAPGGRLVNLGGSAGASASFDSAAIRSRSAAILGYTNNALTAEQRRDALTQIFTHSAAGRLSILYDTAPLSDVSLAWSRQASGRASRRIVILP